jgi:SAM-dependent methyltransferase
MEADDAALRAYYEQGMERERLSDGRGDLEFTRTTEIALRRLPAAPAVVADIGGGPGRYALWLASLGYQVEHRDLMPLHVEQLRAEAAWVAGIRTAVRCAGGGTGYRADTRADRFRAASHRHRDPLVSLPWAAR